MDSLLQSSVFLFLPFVELLILYFLSRKVFIRISQFLDVFIKRSNWTYYLLAFLFLPGTYVHEISHYLMAKILFVRTFSVNLLPKVEGNLVTLGSVQIAKTDFVRRFLVGAAPFIFGTMILIGSMHLLLVNGWYRNPVFISMEAFLMFEIGNTMFMSKRDLEGSWRVFIFLVFIGFLLYLFGVDGLFLKDIILPFESTFRHMSFYLVVPIVIDMILVLFLSLFV